MSDENEYDGSETDDDFKNLRAKAKKADQYERENASLKRDLAFVKAGIPMDDPKMGYFVKGYDGDLEPDSIKQAAVEAGFIQPPAAPPVDPAVQQAQQAQQRVVAASSGVQPDADAAGGLYEMEQAYASGGLDAMFDVARQYGVGKATNEL